MWLKRPKLRTNRLLSVLAPSPARQDMSRLPHLVRLFAGIPVHKLTEPEAATELQRSAKELLRHDDLYYNQDRPVLDDVAYDALVLRNDAIERRFPQMRATDSRSMRVGAPTSSELPKLKHGSRLLSLKNAYDNADVTRYVARVAKRAAKIPLLNPSDNAESDVDFEVAFIAEPKVDGAMASIKYVDGVLHSAATRGDGLVGEDVTKNVRHVQGVPPRLASVESSDVSTKDGIQMQTPHAVEVRGEIYMEEGDFQLLNQERTAASQPEFATARNAAAGK
jgi:DNA ligase (NAD+)